jgi:hypothetical protein
MKQLISDWVLANDAEPSDQSSLAFAGLYADTKLLPDESKVMLLTHLYLELRLNIEQAIRAARADTMMTPKAQTHRLWVEQRR